MYCGRVIISPVNWISNGINETGIKNVVLSGGVAQNIKANKLITELDGLNYLFVPPGPGDESISIGAAYLALLEKKSVSEIIAPANGYLGPSFSNIEIKKSLETPSLYDEIIFHLDRQGFKLSKQALQRDWTQTQTRAYTE